MLSLTCTSSLGMRLAVKWMQSESAEVESIRYQDAESTGAGNCSLTAVNYCSDLVTMAITTFPSTQTCSATSPLLTRLRCLDQLLLPDCILFPASRPLQMQPQLFNRPSFSRNLCRVHGLEPRGSLYPFRLIPFRLTKGAGVPFRQFFFFGTPLLISYTIKSFDWSLERLVTNRLPTRACFSTTSRRHGSMACSLFACGTCMPWKVHAPTTTQKDGIRKCGNWQEKLIQTFTKQSLCSSPSKPPLKSASCSWQQEEEV